jgi:hypothetical protein
MHSNTNADDRAERTAVVGLVLGGLAECVGARLAPETVADLREAVEKGRGDDLTHWLADVVVDALDERAAHVTMPANFRSEGTCERCGGVVTFGIDRLAPGCSAQWENLPEQCVETTKGERCGWFGYGEAAGDGAKEEEIIF